MDRVHTVSISDPEVIESLFVEIVELDNGSKGLSSSL